MWPSSFAAIDMELNTCTTISWNACRGLQTHRTCVASAVMRGNVTFLTFGLVLLKWKMLKHRRGCISQEEWNWAIPDTLTFISSNAGVSDRWWQNQCRPLKEECLSIRCLHASSHLCVLRTRSTYGKVFLIIISIHTAMENCWYLSFEARKTHSDKSWNK